MTTDKDKIEKAIKELKGFQIGYKKAIEDVELFINNYPKPRAEWYKYYIKMSDIKQQLQELKKENK